MLTDDGPHGNTARRTHGSVRSIQRHHAPALAIRVLGGVEAVGPLGTFAPGGARPGAVLAMLVIHAGECVSVDRLVDELWTAESVASAASAAKRLQVNVLRLRRGVVRVAPDVNAAAIVRTSSCGYALQVEPDAIDAVRFERLISRGRAERGSGDARRAAATLGEALALWRGDPYADYAYESFADGEIRRLEELRDGALEAWVEAQLAVGAHVAMTAELDRLVARHPLRERLWALLMLALYRCRRQSEALAVYQQARGVLLDGLGIEPGCELRELQRAILEQSPSLELGRGRASTAPRLALAA
jgi:DNA-binding SARP family transcriptional activator